MIDELIDEFNIELQIKQEKEEQLLELLKATSFFDYSQSALTSDVHQTFLYLNTEE